MEGRDGITSGKIIRIATQKTFEKYEEGIKKIAHFHIRKSKTNDTVEDIINTFKFDLNNPTKLNGVVEDNEGRVIGFFVSSLDTTLFVRLNNESRATAIFIEHLYCPNSYINDLYKTIRSKLREVAGGGDLFIFTHRNPEAWIKLGEQHDVNFETFGYILRDKEE